jgi:hypothetical protein
VLAIKLYRLSRHPDLDVPYLPCLDHEAMLHQRIAPHAAMYVQEAASGDLHEIVFIPADRRLYIDTVSTWREHSADSRDRLLAILRQTFPGYRTGVKGPTWWRGEKRVAEACLAQIPLRDVLLGDDMAGVKASIDRLATIGALMEKESRVASWGVRTLTAPLLAAAGVVTFWILGFFEPSLGTNGVSYLRYLLIGALGAVFVYYGMKAVQLTEMANRVWKRSAEYNLLLAERQRIAAASPRKRHDP